jgi:hypothetical protein
MNKLNKFKNVCLIDNVEITNENGLAISILSKYLKNKHNTTLKEYLLKYYYNNEHPKCFCGCGNDVCYYKGKFGKFYDNHKNLMPIDEHTRLKMIEKIKLSNSLENRLRKVDKTKEELEFAYNEYVNYSQSFDDLTKKLKLDKRTLKKFWVELNLIKDVRKFETISKKHQKIWADKNGKAGGRQLIEDDLLLNIYLFIKNNKGKYTLNEISLKFNVSVSILVLYKRLCENFGETLIKEYLSFGLASKSETEFYNILKYYFGGDLKKGFKLEGKFYDFILLNKIIIEFDGDYWHSLIQNKINDNFKDELARKNNYIIFRVKESESKDITILNKLNKLYETEIKRRKKNENN